MKGQCWIVAVTIGMSFGCSTVLAEEQKEVTEKKVEVKQEICTAKEVCEIQDKEEIGAKKELWEASVVAETEKIDAFFCGKTEGLRSAERQLWRLVRIVDALQDNTFITDSERQEFIDVSVDKDVYVDTLAELMTTQILQQEIKTNDPRLDEKLRCVHKILKALQAVKDEGSKKSVDDVKEGLVSLNAICDESDENRVCCLDQEKSDSPKIEELVVTIDENVEESFKGQKSEKTFINNEQPSTEKEKEDLRAMTKARERAQNRIQARARARLRIQELRDLKAASERAIEVVKSEKKEHTDSFSHE